MDKEHQDKKIKNILTLVIMVMLGFAFVMVVFGAGIYVGQKRAEFSFAWAQNYHRNFGGPKRGIFGNFPEQDFTNAHGVFGQVIEIAGNDLIVKGQDDMEKTVIVLPTTTIVNNAAVAKLSDIKMNDSVVVIGSPDSYGQIQAEFIRILPAGSDALLPIENFTI